MTREELSRSAGSARCLRFTHRSTWRDWDRAPTHEARPFRLRRGGRAATGAGHRRVNRAYVAIDYSASVNDDWRLRVQIGAEGSAGALSKRLEAFDLAHDLKT